MNHGKPRHSRISNVFDPIELLMPMPPWPWFVTMTLETASGTLVPAARNVSPITESGISIVSPMHVSKAIHKHTIVCYINRLIIILWKRLCCIYTIGYFRTVYIYGAMEGTSKCIYNTTKTRIPHQPLSKLYHQTIAPGIQYIISVNRH